MHFVTNVISFPAVKKIEDWLTIGRVIASYMQELFLGHSVEVYYISAMCMVLYG